MQKISDITGVILAGGRARRFGMNKALVPFQGTPMLLRILRVMEGIFEELLLVTNTPETYRPLGIPILTDLKPYQGPLGGIATALCRVKTGAVFAVACDMPLVTASTIRQVVEAGRGHEAAVPLHHDVREYLMALYSRRLLARMNAALERGERSLAQLCGGLTDIVWVAVADDSWFNVNTRQDLKFLEESHAG